MIKSIYIIPLFLMINMTTINDDPYLKKRIEMVEKQIIARGVKNEKVIEAMKKVPRHLFVPEEYRHLAYNDGPLPIGYDQTISQPYIVAYMTEVLDLKGNEKVLEIGTGSGYQAAILGEICKEVYTIEIVEELANRAKKILEDLGYKNIFIKIGDGYKGWPEKAPFDAIIVTCSPTNIPKPLIEQLAENGRMIIPVGEWYNQQLVLLRKKNGKMVRENLIPVRFVPMVNERKKPY